MYAMTKWTLLFHEGSRIRLQGVQNDVGDVSHVSLARSVGNNNCFKRPRLENELELFCLCQGCEDVSCCA